MKKFLMLLAIIMMTFASVTLVSCGDDDNSNSVPTDDTVSYVCSNHSGYLSSSLVSAINSFFTAKIGSYGTVSCSLSGTYFIFSIETTTSNKAKVESILKGISNSELNTELRKTVTGVKTFTFNIASSSNTSNVIAEYTFTAE